MRVWNQQQGGHTWRCTWGDFDGDKYGKFTPLSLEICREEIDLWLSLHVTVTALTGPSPTYSAFFRPAMVEYPNYYPVLFFIHMTVQIGLTWSWHPGHHDYLVRSMQQETHQTSPIVVFSVHLKANCRFLRRANSHHIYQVTWVSLGAAIADRSCWLD
jgi:hypothetical protein